MWYFLYKHFLKILLWSASWFVGLVKSKIVSGVLPYKCIGNLPFWECSAGHYHTVYRPEA